jgi:hypothetical protein
MSAAEIRFELSVDYSQNVMSERTVTQWCEEFKDGQKNVNVEEPICQPSVVSDDLVQCIEQKINEKVLHNFRTIM